MYRNDVRAIGEDPSDRFGEFVRMNARDPFTKFMSKVFGIKEFDEDFNRKLT